MVHVFGHHDQVMLQGCGGDEDVGITFRSLGSRAIPTRVEGAGAQPAMTAKDNCDRTGWGAAHKFPHHELEANSARTPGKVRQMTLVAAMHRG